MKENKTGFLVNPDSVNEICSSIRRLYYNPNLRKQFEEFARVRAQYTFNMYKSDKLLNVFNQL